MIQKFEEFVNEANVKTEEYAWRELIMYTDNVHPIYSYMQSFVDTLISRGEKDNKHLDTKLTKDNYYVQELKHIIDMVKDEDNKNVKKGYETGLANFNSLSEKDQISILANHIADEVEEHEE